MSFEAVELGNKVSKEEFGKREKTLRLELLNAQFDLREADFSMLITVIGDDRIACEEVIDLFQEWMDARHIETHVFVAPTQEEAERPLPWRYWRALPPEGQIGLHFGAWPRDLLVGRILQKQGDKELARGIEHMRRTERMLADDGALILKFWLHAPKKELKKRLKKAKGEGASWRATEDDKLLYEHYDELVEAGEHLVSATDESHAPWIVVESTDAEFRNLRVMETVLSALLERLQPGSRTTAVAPDTTANQLEQKSVLDAVDLTSSLRPGEYKELLKKHQTRLSELSLEARDRGVSTVLAFEGWDAAGKGGAIRRLTRSMAARDYRVFPIAAPTDEERGHHYLWRFWRRVPRAGHMGIFDRTWYGRVLVERVEGFATEAEWRRAYAEIADFESLLVEHGTAVLKFWLHIDADEQLRRFREREQTPYKKYKITGEDYRNRERWQAYVAAVDEMVVRTHRDGAPWVLVPANDKRFARIRVIEEVCAGLERALE